jgi:hypothetical protein
MRMDPDDVLRCKTSANFQNVFIKYSIGIRNVYNNLQHVDT